MGYFVGVILQTIVLPIVSGTIGLGHQLWQPGRGLRPMVGVLRRRR
ncbi:MAG TPA: hypothetical protein VIT42_00700 [Microlunatus sp.]